MLTLTEFKRFLDIDLKSTTKDELLHDCIQSAEEEINGLTNRLLGYGLREDIIDGSGSRFAFLNQYPVSEITKLQMLTESGFADIISPPDAISDSVLILNAGKIGFIKNYIFPEGESNILVQYKAGYFSADPWIENTRYNEGDIVEYQNVFYRCIQTHQSGTNFEKAYWDIMNVEAVPEDLIRAVKYLAARNFYDSTAGKNLLMKKSENIGGGFSGGIVYKDIDIEHIINTYKKTNI